MTTFIYIQLKLQKQTYNSSSRKIIKAYQSIMLILSDANICDNDLCLIGYHGTVERVFFQTSVVCLCCCFSG